MAVYRYLGDEPVQVADSRSRNVVLTNGDTVDLPDYTAPNPDLFEPVKQPAHKTKTTKTAPAGDNKEID